MPIGDADKEFYCFGCGLQYVGYVIGRIIIGMIFLNKNAKIFNRLPEIFSQAVKEGFVLQGVLHFIVISVKIIIKVIGINFLSLTH